MPSDDELLDPVGEAATGTPRRRRFPCTRAERRSAPCSALQQEHRHLRARDRVRRTVVPSAAAARDALRGELLDPVGEERRARHVGEDTRARRRDEARAVLAPSGERPPSARATRRRPGSKPRRRIRPSRRCGRCFRRRHRPRRRAARPRSCRRRGVSRSASVRSRAARRSEASQCAAGTRRRVVDRNGVAVAGVDTASGRPDGERSVSGRSIGDAVRGARGPGQARRRSRRG